MPRSKSGQRPFKVVYFLGRNRVGRVCACGSPEGVVRTTAVRVFSGEADLARVHLDDALFAIIEDDHGKVSLTVM